MVAFNEKFPNQKIKKPIRPRRSRRLDLKKWVGNWFGKSRKAAVNKESMPMGMRAGNWIDQNLMMVFAPISASKRIRERGKYAMLAATQQATGQKWYLTPFF